MTVHEIYDIWEEHRKNDNIRRNFGTGFPEVVYEMRERNKTFGNEDIDVFIGFLSRNDRKAFVANFFAIQKSIPEDLFEPFIDAAIDETDPNLNRDYLKPCLRVFGFKLVSEYLNNRFINGSNQNKIGVCNSYRNVVTQVGWKFPGTEKPKLIGYHLKWNGYAYDIYDWDNDLYFEMSQAEAEACHTEAQQIYKERRKLLLEEFFANQTEGVRHAIYLALPKELSSFGKENLELAKKYFCALPEIGIIDHHNKIEKPGGQGKMGRTLPL